MAGKSAPAGSDAWVDCVTCAAGKFAAAGDALGCQTCAVGKYVDVVNGCSIRVPLDSIMVVSGTPDEAEACLGAANIKTLSSMPLPAMTLNASIWQGSSPLWARQCARINALQARPNMHKGCGCCKGVLYTRATNLYHACHAPDAAEARLRAMNIAQSMTQGC